MMTPTANTPSRYTVKIRKEFIRLERTAPSAVPEHLLAAGRNPADEETTPSGVVRLTRRGAVA